MNTPTTKKSQAAPGTYPHSWMNIVALVASVIGLSLGGIILGHLGLRAAARGEADYRLVGLWGLILGYTGAFLWLVGTVAYVWFMVFIFRECGGDNPATWC